MFLVVYGALKPTLICPPTPTCKSNDKPINTLSLLTSALELEESC